MTNRIAIGLGALIAAFLVLSALLGLDWHIYLARRFVDLVDWMTFWR